MAIYDIIPQRGFNDEDVRDTLNANGGNTTRDNWRTFFTPSAKINKWAKYKPESYMQYACLQDNDRYNNNYGFDLTQWSRTYVGSLFDHASNGNTWSHVLPSGGRESPYRMGDFSGYNPKAETIFDYRYIVKSVETAQASYQASWRVVVNPASEIKISDIGLADTLNCSHYFFIARKDGVYIISSYTSRYGDPEDIQCDITFPSRGVWEWLFCVGQRSDEDIESMLDLIVMPDGYGRFEIKGIVAWIRITYIGGEVTKVSYDKTNYVLNIGDIRPQYTMEAWDSDISISDTELKFGFEMYLYGIDGELGHKEIYSEDANDYYIFSSGNGKQKKLLINFPIEIDLADYFGESELQNASFIRFYPVAKKVTGIGIPSNPTVYYDVSLTE